MTWETMSKKYILPFKILIHKSVLVLLFGTPCSGKVIGEVKMEDGIREVKSENPVVRGGEVVSLSIFEPIIELFFFRKISGNCQFLKL